MSDLHEPTPIRKVSCESCKQRKLKCDRGQPSCQRCAKSKISCLYATRRKPGFPGGQRRVLEDKIGQLEAEVRQRREAESRALLKPSTPAQPLDWSGSVSAGEPEFSRASLAHTNGHASTSTLPPPEQPQGATYERTRRLIERPPPVDLVISLVSLYYRHIHPWLPFLDPARVFAEIGAIDEPSPLYLALFNIALRHSLDSRLDRESSDSYWKYCKRRIFVEALEEPSYTALEALTVVTLDLSGMTNGPQAWGALAVVIKLATQLKTMEGRSLRTRVAQESGPVCDTINHTHRRRLFWAIYALDSYLTITTGNPSDLADCHVQQFLPTRQMTWQGSSRLSADAHDQDWQSQQRSVESAPSSGMGLSTFSHQLELLDLSRSVHNVYLGYVSLDESSDCLGWMEEHAQISAELEAWRLNRSLVPLLNTQSPPVLMLHAYYYALTIHLHGMIICPPYPTTGERLSTEMAQIRCADSVRDLAAIVQQVTPDMIDKLGWSFAWSVWVAGRYLLAGQMYGIPYSAQVLELLLTCLRSMGKYWQISTKYWNLLNQALNEPPQELSASSRPVRSVLSLVTNLRISTSDLEDQFRIDPVLHNRTRPADKGLPLSHAAERAPSWSEPVVQEQEDFPILSEFGQSEQFSNIWYNLPLYPSSAYQQYPPYL